MNLGNQSFQNPANIGMGLNQGPIVSEPRTLQGAEVAAVQIDNSNDEQIFYNPSGGTFKREPQIPAGVSISTSSSQSNFGNQATTSFGNQVTNPVNKMKTNHHTYLFLWILNEISTTGEIFVSRCCIDFSRKENSFEIGSEQLYDDEV